MLGDQPDKARTTIRSAMKRRKAKTVQFAAPTYVDYSDIDYSTEEDDDEAEYFAQQQQQAQQSQQATSESDMDDESAKVEPLKPRSQQKQTKAESKKQEAGADTESSANRTLARVSEEGSEPRGSSDGPKKTSDGTVRDSFFKDDTVETKKITLTPNLLRDDNGPRTSTESREMKQRPSLDKLDKDSILGKDDKKKKKEKEKDKKSGGLRGFFSRKDKKTKGDEDDELYGKRSMDADAPERDAEDEEPQPSPEKAAHQRQPGKLQKQQPRAEPSPTRKANGTKENGVDIKAFLSEGKVNNVANVPPASMRIVEASPKASETGSQDQRPNRDASPSASKTTPSKTPRDEPRPKPTSRMELDISSDDEDMAPEPTRQAAAITSPNTNQTAAQQALASTPSQPQSTERLSESPVQVSPATSASNPPPLVGDDDNSSQGDGDEDDNADDRIVSPVSTPSPELIEHEDAISTHHHHHKNSDSSAMAAGAGGRPSSSSSSSWDDVSLRAFFDSGSDIRDLLVVVFDKNVDPAVEDRMDQQQAVTSGLFREQNAKLAEITTVSFFFQGKS